MQFFGYKTAEEIPCEFCGRPAVDVHHLIPKSIAPKHKVNLITNLIGLCREHHNQAHEFKNFNEDLKYIHRRKCLANGLPDIEREDYIKVH